MHCQILLSRNEFGFLAESDIGQEDRDACRRQLAIGEDQIGGAMPVAERFPVSQGCLSGWAVKPVVEPVDVDFDGPVEVSATQAPNRCASVGG
jgi:hypothetical protein